jgi:hypothetical protein
MADCRYCKRPRRTGQVHLRADDRDGEDHVGEQRDKDANTDDHKHRAGRHRDRGHKPQPAPVSGWELRRDPGHCQRQRHHRDDKEAQIEEGALAASRLLAAGDTNQQKVAPCDGPEATADQASEDDCHTPAYGELHGASLSPARFRGALPISVPPRI